MARILEFDYGIVVEKADLKTILFIVVFQSTLEDVKTTVAILQAISRRHIYIPYKNKSKQNKNMSNIIGEYMEQMQLSKVDIASLVQTERIPLDQACGRIAAENIIPYPPGVPLTIKGEEFTQEAIRYYMTLKKIGLGGTILHRESLNKVHVVK